MGIGIEHWNPHRECITVVIPTMLLGPQDIFGYTLKELEESDLIKQIIIIDNTENKDFDKKFPITSKILVLKNPGNQGASYNSGMELCKSDYYLLLNDDIACRRRVLIACFGVMEQDKNIGLLQVKTIVRQPLQQYINSDLGKNAEFTYLEPFRYNMTGWFQMGRTEDWFPIPKELKYFYGDDLLLESMRRKGRKVARVISDHISHYEASTVNKVLVSKTGGHDGTIVREGEIYKEVLKKMGWDK